MHLQRKVRQGGSGHYGQQPGEVTYRLEVFDNHPIAVIDGRRVVIDIGSPISIGNSELLEIAGLRQEQLSVHNICLVFVEIDLLHQASDSPCL